MTGAELSVGWVDPRVGSGWVGNGLRIFVVSGFGWVMRLKLQIVFVGGCVQVNMAALLHAHCCVWCIRCYNVHYDDDDDYYYYYK